MVPGGPGRELARLHAGGGKLAYQVFATPPLTTTPIAVIDVATGVRTFWRPTEKVAAYSLVYVGAEDFGVELFRKFGGGYRRIRHDTLLAE